MSIKKSIITNGISALFQKLIKVAEQLFLIPFFINYWGAAYYGEWLTLTIVPASLALADIGFGTAAANTFLLKYAAGDKQGAANVSKTGLRVLTFIVVTAILISMVIIYILNYFDVFAKSLIPSQDAIWAVIILLIARILNFYPTIFEAYYRAARKANISINFQTLIAATNIGIGLIIILRGGKVVEYASGSLFVVVVMNPIYIIYAQQILGLRKTNIGKIEKKFIIPLIKKGFGYFLSPVWQAIYYQGMTFIIRLALGPIAVTTFTTIRTLIRSSAQAFGMSITSVYPDFQFETGVGNHKKAKKIFIGVLALNIVMAIIFMIGLLLFGEELYNWWTKNALYVPKNIWLVFIMGIPFYSLWFTFSFIFEALNKPYTNTISGFICSIFVVIISWFLSKYFGLLGAAIGSLIFDLIMCYYLVRKGINEINLSIQESIYILKVNLKTI